jgi:hypothetical protein
MEALNDEPDSGTPALDLGRGLPMADKWTIPVEIYMLEFLERVLVSMVGLAEVPVEEAVNRVDSLRDAQLRHVFGDLHRNTQGTQRMAKAREGAQGVPCLVIAKRHELVADPIVRKLPDRSFLGVDVEQHTTLWSQRFGQLPECREWIGNVVEHALAENQISTSGT